MDLLIYSLHVRDFNVLIIVKMETLEIADSSFANVTYQRFWIGVNNISGTGWTNLDGSNVTYFNWASGEPANSTPTNGCVSVDLRGSWYNDDCYNITAYVCEVPEVETVTTTTTTPTTTHLTTTESTTTHLTTIESTTLPPSFTCKSYVPIVVDYSLDIGFNQFAAIKNFLINTFLFKTLSDVQPAPYVQYGYGGYFNNTLPNSIEELVSQIRAMNAFGYNDDSDFFQFVYY